MLRPSGLAPIAITSAPAPRSASGATMWAAPCAQSTTMSQPVEPCGQRRQHMGDVAVHLAVGVADPADGRADGAVPGLAEPPLDLVLDLVGQLEAAAGEELDAVVGRRVVRGRQHDAEVGAERCREVGDGRSGQHAEAQHIHSGRRQAGDHSGFEKLPRGSRVPAYDRYWPPTAGRSGERARIAEDVSRRDRKGHGDLRREVATRDPTHPVGAEQTRQFSACCTAEPYGPS